VGWPFHIITLSFWWIGKMILHEGKIAAGDDRFGPAPIQTKAAADFTDFTRIEAAVIPKALV
jgi:hypothetical protein